MKIKYKDFEIELLDLCIKDNTIYPKGQWVRVAPEWLSGIVIDEDGKYPDKEAMLIDELIYHYVPDDVFKKADLKDIAENYLDEEFELCEGENEN